MVAMVSAALVHLAAVVVKERRAGCGRLQRRSAAWPLPLVLVVCKMLPAARPALVRLLLHLAASRVLRQRLVALAEPAVMAAQEPMGCQALQGNLAVLEAEKVVGQASQALLQIQVVAVVVATTSIVLATAPAVSFSVTNLGSSKMRYAIVDNGGKVVNLIDWDGAGDWVPPAGTTAVRNDIAAIGGTIINVTYTPPVPAPATPEQQANKDQRARVVTFGALPDTADLAQRLKNATPAQIDTWIDGNVTNLAQARDVLKAIVKLLATQID